jgi:hypothetical protein
MHCFLFPLHIFAFPVVAESVLFAPQSMSQNILASGWLDKTGGAGHGHKNTRRRWFVLKGLTLLYYGDKPVR